MLTKEIEDFLLEQNKKRREERSRTIGVYWPSDCSVVTPKGIIGKCLRDVWYSFFIPPTNPFTAQKLRLFQAGNDIEAREREYLKEIGILEGHNVKFQKDIGEGIVISGEVDILARRETELFGIEVKTGYGYFWEKEVFGSRGEYPSPQEHHIIQASIYLDHYSEEGVERFIIYYIHRGTLAQKEFELRLIDGVPHYRVSPRTREAKGRLQPVSWSINEVYDRVRTLHTYVVKEEPAPRDYDPLWSPDKIEDAYLRKQISPSAYKRWQRGEDPFVSDWRCKGCLYRKACIQGTSHQPAAL